MCFSKPMIVTYNNQKHYLTTYYVYLLYITNPQCFIAQALCKTFARLKVSHYVKLN
jgi:hypothetical protein